MNRFAWFAKIAVLIAFAGSFAAGCGDGNGTAAHPTAVPSATRTPLPVSTATPTPAGPTATPTPTATTGTAGVTGLVVLNRNVNAGSSDALGAPPQQWAESADSQSFDRSLAAADWSIDGSIGGVTGADGRFSVQAL